MLISLILQIFLISAVWSKIPKEVDAFEQVLSWGVKENVIQPAQKDSLKSEFYRILGNSCNISIEETNEAKENLENLFSEFIIYEIGLIIFVGGLFVLVMQADMISPDGVFLLTVSDFILVSIFAHLIALQYKTTTSSVGLLFLVALMSLPCGFFGIHYKLNQAGKKWNKKPNYFFTKLRHFSSCCIISEVVTIVMGILMLFKLNYMTTILLVPVFVSCILLLDNIQPYIVTKLLSGAVVAEEEKHQFQQITFFLSTFLFGWTVVLLGALFGSSVVMENVKFWFFFFGSLYISISLFGTANFYWHPKSQIALIWTHVALVHLGIKISSNVVIFFGSLGVVIYFIISLVEVFTKRKNAVVSQATFYSNLFFTIFLYQFSIDKKNTLLLIVGIIGFFWWNMVWAYHPVASGKETSEFIYLFQLVTNFLILLKSGQCGYHFIIFSWGFDGDWWISLVATIGLAMNIIWSFVYGCTKPSVRMNTWQNSYWLFKNAYIVYRVFICLLFCHMSILLDSHGLAWVGMLGIGIFIWTKLFLQNPDYRKNWWHMLPPFLLSCVLIMISSLFSDEVYFLVGLYYLFHCMKQVSKKTFPFFVLLCFVIALALIANKLLLSIYCMLAILYFIFELIKKEFPNYTKILFPIALIFMGSVLLFFAYKNYGKSLSSIVISFILKILYGGVDRAHIIEALSLSREESPVILMMKLQRDWSDSFAYLFLAISTNILSTLNYYATSNFILLHTFIAIVVAVIFFFKDLQLAQSTLKKRRSSRNSLDSAHDPTEPLVELGEVQVYFPMDTNSSGLVFLVSGTKPLDFVPKSIDIECEEPSLNQKLCVEFPLNLYQNKISKFSFKKDSNTFEGIIQICTGLQKEPKLPQTEVSSALRKMLNNPRCFGDKCTFILTYTLPNGKSGLFCKYDFKYSQILNEVGSIARKGFMLKTYLDKFNAT
jgi:hypothetical protein